MSISDPEPDNTAAAPDYLRVNAFMGHLVGAEALGTAMELGLVDYLAERGACAPQDLERNLRLAPSGRKLLVDILKAHEAIEEAAGRLRFTPGFSGALKYRDLLEARLEFARLALPDFLTLLPTLMRSPAQFQRQARVFGLFDYQRCLERTPENKERAKRWMRITTALTRYEAPVCLAHHDFSRYRRMLDVGGNSGEFTLQVCRRHPSVRAVVFDLPVVCDVGREYIASEPEAARIVFAEGNALADPWPGGRDLITFKSMLHDWPEMEAQQLLARAGQSLVTGGTVLIFERGPVEAGPGIRSYGLIPFLLFAHCFRPPGLYADQLRELGFRDIAVQRIELETPFYLVTGVRTG